MNQHRRLIIGIAATLAYIGCVFGERLEAWLATLRGTEPLEVG